jgi:predicted PurR-regulated permease PerM
MNFARPSVFWIALLIAFVAIIVLLRGVLLPFAAALILAYLLDPLANKVDRLGIGRLATTLVPAAAAIGVLVRFALREYYASPLYATTSPASLADIPSKDRESDA